MRLKDAMARPSVLSEKTFNTRKDTTAMNPLIEKAPETMTAKQRVQKTFSFEPTDRVTIGYDTNPEIHKRLCGLLGIDPQDMESVYRALGVDYRSIAAPYIGPDLFERRPDRWINQVEGSIMRWVEHETGGYWDFCDFPLQDAEDCDFESFPVPSPDNFDYEKALDKAKSYNNQYGLYAGNPGICDIINSNGRLMGMEDILCHLITQNDAALDLIRRRAASQLGMLERLLDKCKGHIDFLWLGEDLGSQNAPIIGLELYRQVLKPIHKQFVDLAASQGLPVLIHTCGNSSWVYDDFLEMGIRGVDTLQPEAKDMSPEYLAGRFGGRLNFRGCISTAGPLVTGTPEQVEQVCKETLEIMMPHKGYHFAPTHMIQDNTPAENVIAMYNAAHKFGRY